MSLKGNGSVVVYTSLLGVLTVLFVCLFVYFLLSFSEEDFLCGGVQSSFKLDINIANLS